MSCALIIRRKITNTWKSEGEVGMSNGVNLEEGIHVLRLSRERYFPVSQKLVIQVNGLFI